MDFKLKRIKTVVKHNGINLTVTHPRSIDPHDLVLKLWPKITDGITKKILPRNYTRKVKIELTSKRGVNQIEKTRTILVSGITNRDIDPERIERLRKAKVNFEKPLVNVKGDFYDEKTQTHVWLNYTGTALVKNGVDLSDHLKSLTSLDARKEVALKVIGKVGRFHAAAGIHGDLFSTNNIMINPRGVVTFVDYDIDYRTMRGSKKPQKEEADGVIESLVHYLNNGKPGLNGLMNNWRLTHELRQEYVRHFEDVNQKQKEPTKNPFPLYKLYWQLKEKPKPLKIEHQTKPN